MHGPSDNDSEHQPLLGRPNLGRVSPTLSEVSALSFTSQCGEGSGSMRAVPPHPHHAHQPGPQAAQAPPKPAPYRYPLWTSPQGQAYVPPNMTGPVGPQPPLQTFPVAPPAYPWMGYYPAQNVGRLTHNKKYPTYAKVLNWLSVGVVFLNLVLDIFFAKYAWVAATLLLCGPLAAFFALWAVFVNQCGCYATLEKTTRDVRVLATTAIVFDAAGALAIPLIFYSIICPDDQLMSCEHDIPMGRGLSVAHSLVMTVHMCALLVLRRNAENFASIVFKDNQNPGHFHMQDLQVHPTQGSFYGRHPMSMSFSGIPSGPVQPMYQ